MTLMLLGSSETLEPCCKSLIGTVAVLKCATVTLRASVERYVTRTPPSSRIAPWSFKIWPFGARVIESGTEFDWP